MITKEKYISETEHAVKSFFDTIEHYKYLIKLSIPPCTSFQYPTEEDFQKQYKQWRDRPDTVEAFEIAELAREEYRAQLFSMHVVSGSILHIACKAIELFPPSSSLKSEYEFLVDGCGKGLRKKAQRYCVGREVRGVPLGLIILAGRNQYNHIEAGPDLDPLNINIFNALAKGHDYGQDILDPAFELDSNGLVSYSSNIRAVIGWDNYQSYISDINDLLQ